MFRMSTVTETTVTAAAPLVVAPGVAGAPTAGAQRDRQGAAQGNTN